MALFAATRSSTVRGTILSQVAVVYFYAPRRKLKVCLGKRPIYSVTIPKRVKFWQKITPFTLKDNLYIKTEILGFNYLKKQKIGDTRKNTYPRIANKIWQNGITRRYLLKHRKEFDIIQT